MLQLDYIKNTNRLHISNGSIHTVDTFFMQKNKAKQYACSLTKANAFLIIRYNAAVEFFSAEERVSKAFSNSAS